VDRAFDLNDADAVAAERRQDAGLAARKIRVEEHQHEKDQDENEKNSQPFKQRASARHRDRNPLLRIASFALFRPRLFVAVEPQLLVQDCLEGEPAAFFFALEIIFHLLALLGLLEGADTETELALVRIDVDHLGLDAVTGLEQARRLVDPLAAELGDVDEPLDAFLQPDKDAEIGDAGALAFHLRADGIFLSDYMPGVGGERLDTEAEARDLYGDAVSLQCSS